MEQYTNVIKKAGLKHTPVSVKQRFICNKT